MNITNLLADLTRDIDTFPYEFVAVDLDRTALDKRMRISKSNRAALKALGKLAMSAPVTGRSYWQTVGYYHDLKLIGPIVASDGADVRIPGGLIIQQSFIEQRVASTLRVMAADADITTISHSSEGIYAVKGVIWDAAVKRQRTDIGSRFCRARSSDLLDVPSFKISCRAEKRALDQLAQSVEKRYAGSVHTIRHDPTMLDFTPFGIDKVSGLIAVAKFYGLDLSEILAFGDGVNDVNMLKSVGLGVCMHHGSETAREAADMVAPKTAPGSNLAAAIVAVLRILAAQNRMQRKPSSVAS